MDTIELADLAEENEYLDNQEFDLIDERSCYIQDVNALIKDINYFEKKLESEFSSDLDSRIQSLLEEEKELVFKDFLVNESSTYQNYYHKELVEQNNFFRAKILNLLSTINKLRILITELKTKKTELENRIS
jgi:hypothetical protein